MDRPSGLNVRDATSRTPTWRSRVAGSAGAGGSFLHWANRWMEISVCNAAATWNG